MEPASPERLMTKSKTVRTSQTIGTAAAGRPKSRTSGAGLLALAGGCVGIGCRVLRAIASIRSPNGC